jgi:hypothetical protein
MIRASVAALARSLPCSWRRRSLPPGRQQPAKVDWTTDSSAMPAWSAAIADTASATRSMDGSFRELPN